MHVSLLNMISQVNAKMREAGFSGHSRGLKTMRDETTLINTIIASIQAHCGFEQAGILYHIVFGEPSNTICPPSITLEFTSCNQRGCS